MNGNLLLSQLLPIGLGYSILNLMFPRRALPFLFQIAVAYGLGNGILCQWMLVLGIVGIPYSLFSIGFPLAFVMGAAGFLKLARKKEDLPYPFGLVQGRVTHADIFFRVILSVYIGYNVLSVFILALFIPIMSWDVVSVYALQGKIIFLEQSLEYHRNFPHYSYPMHMPFLMAWISFNLGQWHEQLVKIISPCTLTCYLVIQYYFVRRFTTVRWALVSLALLVSAPLVFYHGSIPYREMSALYYYASILIFLTLWHRDKKDQWLYLAALFGGFLSFVKLEGLIYLAINYLTFIFLLAQEPLLNFGGKFKKFLKFSLPSMGIALIYTLYKQFFIVRYLPPRVGIPKDFDLHYIYFSLTRESLIRSLAVLERMGQNLFLTGNWNILWVVFIVSLLSRKKKQFEIEIAALLFNILTILTVFYLGYSFTQHYIWILKDNFSMSRNTVHFFPLLTILIVLCLCPKADKDSLPS